jgi:Arc/MetJ family transcription regulator
VGGSLDSESFAFRYLKASFPLYCLVMPSSRRKTSFEIDTAKVSAAKEVLGTRTLTDTVDAALAEVIRLRQRRQLVDLLFRPGALALDRETMADAWR